LFPNKAGFKTCFPGNHLAQGKFFGTPSAKHKASLSDFQYISYAFNKYDPIFFLRGLQVSGTHAADALHYAVSPHLAQIEAALHCSLVAERGAEGLVGRKVGKW
jgi:hypothetical protein